MLRVFILVVITMTISNVHALDERNATINLINDFEWLKETFDAAT